MFQHTTKQTSKAFLYISFQALRTMKRTESLTLHATYIVNNSKKPFCLTWPG